MAGKNKQQNQGADEELENQNPNFGMLPRTLGAPADGSDLIGDDEEEDEELDEVGQLRSTIESLQSNSKEEKAYYQRLLTAALQARPGQPDAPAGGGSDEINFDDLPDPVEDRAGFNKALGAKVSTLLQNTTRQVTSQATVQQQISQLENDFRTTYSDLAAKPALLQAAVAQETAALRELGLDPRQAIFADSPGFLKKVAKRMRNELGLPEDGGDGQQQQQRRQRVNRTAGVSAGSRGAQGGKGKKGQGDEKPVGFVDQLKKQQLAMGII